MNKPVAKRSLFVLVIVLAIIITIVYCGVRLGSAVFSDSVPEQEISTGTRKTITVDGVDYFPRQDITVVLAMGIDKEGKVESSNSYNNDGESDVISLLIFDNQDETFTILNINRDSMVEMPVLGVGGRKIGTQTAQLALSHTYGSGLEDSCENTRDTVSKLLKGVNIDYYIAANMDAIGIINDVVGGVKVNVTDDFSQIDPTIPIGEVVLDGQQAMHFVRLRKGVGDQLNISRMERQQEYVEGFIEALGDKMKNDSSFPYDLYTAAEGYFVTDCSFNAFTGLFDEFSQYSLKEVITLKGENKVGKKFMEYHLDRQFLEKTVLDVFYAPKK